MSKQIEISYLNNKTMKRTKLKGVFMIVSFILSLFIFIFTSAISISARVDVKTGEYVRYDTYVPAMPESSYYPPVIDEKEYKSLGF